MSLMAAIVVNYASSALLARNLPADLPAEIRIVVVDNHSSDPEAAAIAALANERGWTLVRAPNHGFGAGVNLGAATARRLGCTELLLLNPDVIIDPDTIAALHDAVRADPRALVCPRLVDPSGGQHFDGFLLDLATGRTRRGWPGDDQTTVGWLSAACLATSLAAFDELGGLDPGYFMYWEDVELSWRARAADMRLLLRDDLVAVHDEGGTQHRRGAAKSDLYYRYNARNRLRFAVRNLPAHRVRSWLRATPAQTWQIWLRGGRRQLFTHPGSLLAAGRGALDGAWRSLGPSRGRRADPPRSGPRRVLLAHPGAELYGSDRVLLETVDALVSAGYPTVVTVPVAGPLVDELRARQVPVEICWAPVLRKAALRPAGLFRLGWDAIRLALAGPGLVRRHRTDLLLVNTITNPGWLILGRLAGLGVVCHVHEAEPSASRLVWRLLYAPLWCCQVIVANSRFTRDAIGRVWPQLQGRCRVVANGVPGPAAPVAALRSQPGEPRLLYVGRLSPRKGPQLAIEALGLLAAQGSQARLTLLGSAFTGYEWFETQLHEQVDRLGLGDRVTFLGYRPEIWSVLAEHDIVIAPSVGEESFGNIVIEAMLAGRPAVVSRTMAEAAQGFAAVRVVEPEPDQIAAAVSGLLAEWPRLAAQLLADRSAAVERFAPAGYAQRMIAALTAAVRR